MKPTDDQDHEVHWKYIYILKQVLLSYSDPHDTVCSERRDTVYTETQDIAHIEAQGIVYA